MAGKIFVNYRRDDSAGDARGVRDGLAAKFGKASVFMDVDNLHAGERFDVKLAQALDACDVLIAVIGPRWLEQLKARIASGDRDYVLEEIAAALKRRIIVIPVRVGREGAMLTFPRPDELPEEIRELVLYQKHDIAHERFGRDTAELNEAIITVRRTRRPQLAKPGVPWRLVGATLLGLMAIASAGAYLTDAPVPWANSNGTPAVGDDEKQRADAAEMARAKAAAEDTTRQKDEAAASAKAEQDSMQQEAAAQARHEAEEDLKKNWIHKIVGDYDGYVVSSSERTSAKTTFSSDGQSGRFQYRNNDSRKGKRTVDGTLHNCQPLRILVLKCNWLSEWRSGVMTVTFTDDFASFDGSWNSKSNTGYNQWTGTRQQ